MPTERAPDYNDHTDEARPAKPASRSAPNLEPNEARGGVTQHNVRVVLAASMAGAVVILAIVYFAFFG
jgi:thiamine monophosphate synthase